MGEILVGVGGYVGYVGVFMGAVEKTRGHKSGGGGMGDIKT